MRHRGKLRGDELAWRSHAALLVHRKPFVYGTIVTSKRKCGNINCKCKKEKNGGHVSSYLSVRVGKDRKMIFIPARMLAKVREWTKTHKEISGHILKISESCLDRIKEEKFSDGS